MTFSDYRYLVLSDLYRLGESLTLATFLKRLFLGTSFQYLFWMRTCGYLRCHAVLKFALYPLARIMLRRVTFKFGISIPPTTKIGPGFLIGHFGAIVVNSDVTIGRNCNISQCVTLGKASRGKNKGAPVLGDNVYLGPGAKIVGAVRIGNNVAVGANCVVTKDVPDDAVVVGVPGKVISYRGSAGYINRTGYDDKIKRRTGRPTEACGAIRSDDSGTAAGAKAA
jgi:serine O-acetyltransferase